LSDEYYRTKDNINSDFSVSYTSVCLQLGWIFKKVVDELL